MSGRGKGGKGLGKGGAKRHRKVQREGKSVLEDIFSRTEREDPAAVINHKLPVFLKDHIVKRAASEPSYGSSPLMAAMAPPAAAPLAPSPYLLH